MLLFSHFCFKWIQSVEQDGGHAAAARDDVEIPLVDPPFDERSAVENDEILDDFVHGARRVDAALVLAQLHELAQHAVVHAPVVLLQNVLLRVLDGVNERLVEHRFGDAADE